MEITEYSVEKIKDPFGILDGQRYEYLLQIEVDEEDELYSPSGLYVRAVYKQEGAGGSIIRHEIRERGSDRLLDFGLEDEELAELETFCKEHIADSEANG
ncbi:MULTISPECIES: DUF6509 family protein [Paenibacillus]|uniref:DUF6509 family protein n=1 Tax=Paenibacillus TaxID=44249 RepID=UPI000413E855|nr:MULTISPECIES: DUF6509 family protein [Paenibacillus]KKC46585.1 pullulanase [Paenibacillus sp. D9]CDN45933.1 Putative uncharacterized protein [Paenibacillus sp. P22]